MNRVNDLYIISLHLPRAPAFFQLYFSFSLFFFQQQQQRQLINTKISTASMIIQLYNVFTFPFELFL